MFFDRENVIKHVKDGTKSALSKLGSYVRRTAKGLIRPGKKAAKPGNPPHSHAGQLKELIYFGYDEQTESMVVGPQLFKRRNPTVPDLLEHGGTTTDYRGRRATYRGNPFMLPALEKESAKAPSLFANAIHN